MGGRPIPRTDGEKFVGLHKLYNEFQHINVTYTVGLREHRAAIPCLPNCLLFKFFGRDVYRLCYDVSVCLSVRLSVTEVQWRIMANLGFKFRSKFTAHCGRGEGHLNNNISRYTSHC